MFWMQLCWFGATSKLMVNQFLQLHFSSLGVALFWDSESILCVVFCKLNQDSLYGPLMSGSSKPAPLCWASWNSVALFHSGCTIEELISFKFICSNPDLGGQQCSVRQSVHSHNVLIQGPANKHGGSVCYSKRDPGRGRLIAARQKTTVAHHHAISALQGEFGTD